MAKRTIVALALVGAGVTANVDNSLQAKVAELQKQLEESDAAFQIEENRLRKLQATTTPAPAKVMYDTVMKNKATVADYQGACNHVWLLLCGSLVMFMQAGFAMVEAGCCRAKNVQNILLKNLTDVAVGTMGWWLCGWSFAYSGPFKSDPAKSQYKENGFMGYEAFLGHDFLKAETDGKQIPTDTIVNWFFQWAFCSAAATIVSGGVAERVNFPGYCLFSLAMAAFIYPVVVSWTWGYGWLADMNDVGYMDFAGSGIVHMAGGVGALVGAICAGPRTGRWEFPDEFIPHSLPLVVLGTFILWFGWYGFNCGSTLSLDSHEKGQLAAQVAMNTTIGGATGGLTVFILRLIIQKGLYDIGGFCNGALAGLVAITAGCSNVECGSAFGITLVGACMYQGFSMLMIKVKVDDPIDAFAVHGVNGAWGTLSAALFDWGKGFDSYHGWSGFSCMKNKEGTACASGYGGQGLAANVVGILAIASWVTLFSVLIFLPLRFTGKLRASDAVQHAGMDSAKHSPTKAYSINESEHTTAITI
eukprot:TRINITY_DN1731_c0_g1_i1.p1 TRINITY_DN1731_c0_g1~~TRINITY_DN1731_c0_g1_i1.p1  ORF type:complete len:531 (-),score=132.05 TRINITY_DN1731_c0_g1_i1:409-2001(-)